MNSKDQLVVVLKKIYDKYPEIFFNEEKLLSVFSDLAPTLQREKKIIKSFVANGGLQFVKQYTNKNHPQNEIMYELKNIIEKMNIEDVIGHLDSYTICFAFGAVVGLKIPAYSLLYKEKNFEQGDDGGSSSINSIPETTVKTAPSRLNNANSRTTSNNNGTLFAVFLLLLVIVFGGWFYFQQNQKPDSSLASGQSNQIDYSEMSSYVDEYASERQAEYSNSDNNLYNTEVIPYFDMTREQIDNIINMLWSTGINRNYSNYNEFPLMPNTYWIFQRSSDEELQQNPYGAPFYTSAPGSAEPERGTHLEFYYNLDLYQYEEYQSYQRGENSYDWLWYNRDNYHINIGIHFANGSFYLLDANVLYNETAITISDTNKNHSWIFNHKTGAFTNEYNY